MSSLFCFSTVCCSLSVSRVKEGAIPTEVACNPCHGVSNGITNCCTGVRQPKVHMLKYKGVQER